MPTFYDPFAVRFPCGFRLIIEFNNRMGLMFGGMRIGSQLTFDGISMVVYRWSIHSLLIIIIILARFPIL